MPRKSFDRLQPAAIARTSRSVFSDHFPTTRCLLNAIDTDRLQLIPASIAHLEAELESTRSLADRLGASVPASWPPGEYDRGAIEFFRDRMLADPESVGWYGWYAIDRANSIVVGAAGYLGPPNDRGCVEIGYSIAPEFTSRGFATEIVRALVTHALAGELVWRVIAHTHRENEASSKVLERCGFSLVPARPEVEGSEVDLLEYELLRRDPS